MVSNLKQHLGHDRKRRNKKNYSRSPRYNLAYSRPNSDLIDDMLLTTPMKMIKEEETDDEPGEFIFAQQDNLYRTIS